MARIPLPTQADEPEAFALIHAKRGHAPNAEIFRAIAICPEILEAFIPMADAVRKGYGIDPKLREMAIVMTCQTMGTSYEHNPHWNRAIKEGVPKEKMLALWDFEKSALFSELERAVLRLARDATGTGAGIVLGTLRYMAPEQLRGEDVQPAADLWALAVIAHEMLTGTHPFATPGSSGEPRSPTALGAPAERFFAQALAVDPANRPRSAARFAEDLAAALTL